MATGDVIGFLHADDLYATDTVLKTVAECFERQNVDSCYGDLVYVDKNNTNKTIRYWKSSPFDSKLLKKGWMPPHPTFFVKRTVYEKCGGFDATFKIAADYELMIRFLGKHGISTCYIPELLVKMRVGGASNRSISNVIRKSWEDYRIIRRHGLGGLYTLLQKNLSKVPQFFENSKE
jgi:glycosyltransferase